LRKAAIESRPSWSSQCCRGAGWDDRLAERVPQERGASFCDEYKNVNDRGRSAHWIWGGREECLLASMLTFVPTSFVCRKAPDGGLFADGCDDNYRRDLRSFPQRRFARRPFFMVIHMLPIHWHARVALGKAWICFREGVLGRGTGTGTSVCGRDWEPLRSLPNVGDVRVIGGVGRA